LDAPTIDTVRKTYVRIYAPTTQSFNSVSKMAKSLIRKSLKKSIAVTHILFCLS